MTRPVDETPAVHQILFGPGPDGVAPIVSSLATPNDLEMWNNRLLPLCRLESYADQDVPHTSLSYFSFSDEHAAVVRRVDNGRTKGRGHAHALVGGPDLLTPERAVTLGQWSGWLDRATAEHQGALPTVSMHTAGYRYRTAKPDAIAALVAALLRRPTGNLTVVGVENSDRIPLLRDVLLVAGALFAGSDISRKWTFSTYERTVEPGTKTAAEIVFLPAIVDGVTNVAGTVVHLGHTTTDDTADRIASALAETYVAHGADAIAGLLVDYSVADCPALQDRIALLGSLFDGSVSAQTPPAPLPEPADSPSAGTIPMRTPSESPDTVLAPHSPLEIAQELRRSDDPNRMVELVGLLRELAPSKSAVDRSRMRSQLLDPHFTADRIDTVAERAPGVYGAIATHCLGEHLEDLTPRDRNTLAAVCGLLSRHTTSPGLVRVLVDQATRTPDKTTLLLAALGLRDLRVRGFRVPEPGWEQLFCADPAAHNAPPAPTAQIYSPRPHRGRSQPPDSRGTDYRLVLFVSAVLIFLLGLVMGVVA